MKLSTMEGPQLLLQQKSRMPLAGLVYLFLRINSPKWIFMLIKRKWLNNGYKCLKISDAVFIPYFTHKTTDNVKCHKIKKKTLSFFFLLRPNSLHNIANLIGRLLILNYFLSPNPSRLLKKQWDWDEYQKNSCLWPKNYQEILNTLKYQVAFPKKVNALCYAFTPILLSVCFMMHPESKGMPKNKMRTLFCVCNDEPHQAYLPYITYQEKRDKRHEMKV